MPVHMDGKAYSSRAARHPMRTFGTSTGVRFVAGSTWRSGGASLYAPRDTCPASRVAEHRYFYPIDWPQLSREIRFRRAGGACEGCGRPHGGIVYRLGDGRWRDAEVGAWRDGRGKSLTELPKLDDLTASLWTTRVVLATAHRNHDTANDAGANLAAFCQRCHMIHDRPEHRRRRWRRLFRRRALGDLFRGAYPP